MTFTLRECCGSPGSVLFLDKAQASKLGVTKGAVALVSGARGSALASCAIADGDTKKKKPNKTQNVLQISSLAWTNGKFVEDSPVNIAKIGRVADLSELNLCLMGDWKTYDELQKPDHLALLKTSLVGLAVLPCLLPPIDIFGTKILLRIDVVDGPARIANSTKLVIFPTLTPLAVNGATPSQGFSRVGGMSKTLEKLVRYVKAPLLHRDEYKKFGIEPLKGILLYGPPGTGKSLLMTAISEELAGKAATEFVVASDFASKIVGETDERLRGLFERAALRSTNEGIGTMICIDEIDALCPKRENVGELEKRIVSTILSYLDGPRAVPKLIVIGTTNDPNSIDPALRRPGRLDREIEIGVPTAEDRGQILRLFLKKLPQSLTEEQIDMLAGDCHAFVGADLKALCTTAAQMGLSRHVEDSGAATITWEDFEAALKDTKPSALREMTIEVPRVHWDDIGGYEELKQKLKESVEWPLKHAEMFSALRLSAPKGVLLFGPPGCSKTLMAKAVATESKMNFIAVKGPELFSKWVGESELAVRNLFRKARQNAPCVIFLDECDALAADRQSGRDGGGVENRVLSQILNEMDGIGMLAQVIVIGATNRPELIDSALMRPGRFDRPLYVPLPDEAAREKIFLVNLKNIDMEETDQNWSHELASRTSGCSGAEISLICREASMNRFRDFVSTGVVGQPMKLRREDFEKALASVKPRTSAETVQFYEDYLNECG